MPYQITSLVWKLNDFRPRILTKWLRRLYNYEVRKILYKTSTNTPLKHFKLRSIAEMSYQFTFDEDQQWEAQPIYLSSDESESSLPCNQLPNNVPDSYGAITLLIASKHEQMSASRNLTLEYPPTPPTSSISDDDKNEIFTPIVGNPTQNVPYVPNRHPHPLPSCQQLTPIPDTPESPTPEKCGQPGLFRPHNLPHTPTTSAYPLPSVSTVIEGLQNMTLHAHVENNAYVTGCLICGKPYEKLIEETVADYLHQTVEPGESIWERVLQRNEFVDSLQCGVFSLVPGECRRLPRSTT